MTSRGTASLAVQDLWAAYDGGPDVLRGLTLDVGAGELVGLIGPSGSGKSTLLRAIAGLVPVGRGRVVLGDAEVTSVPVHRRNLSLMFQDHALFGHLDVAANVAYGLARRGWSAADQRARVAELLALVDLDGFGRRPVSSLSGGQAQRVALARALAPRPSVLLLDEPMASLDLVLRRQLADEIARITAAEGVTTLLVTHDQTEASGLAQRLAVLDDGRVVQVGPPAEVWHRPVNRFVAEFLGHPNVWPQPDGTTLVVPVTALEVVDDSGYPGDGPADLRVRVERVSFDEGRVRAVGAAIDNTALDNTALDKAADGRRFTFFAAGSLAVGDEVGLRIDRAATVTLDS